MPDKSPLCTREHPDFVLHKSMSAHSCTPHSPARFLLVLGHKQVLVFVIVKKLSDAPCTHDIAPVQFCSVCIPCIQEPDLYESGWTPLMASTVAPASQHLEVASLLLRAAASFVPATAGSQPHEHMKGGRGGQLNGSIPQKHLYLQSSTAADMVVAANRCTSL